MSGAMFGLFAKVAKFNTISIKYTGQLYDINGAQQYARNFFFNGIVTMHHYCLLPSLYYIYIYIYIYIYYTIMFSNIVLQFNLHVIYL